MDMYIVTKYDMQGKNEEVKLHLNTYALFKQEKYKNLNHLKNQFQKSY